MSIKSYSEWHTLTIELDGVDDDGNPLPLHTLDHPDSCPPPDPDYAIYECWLADLVGESGDFPDAIGLPTKPGIYRIRAWGTSGDWAGAHYIEPDSGVEIEEEQ